MMSPTKIIIVSCSQGEGENGCPFKSYSGCSYSSLSFGYYGTIQEVEPVHFEPKDGALTDAMALPMAIKRRLPEMIDYFDAYTPTSMAVE